MSWHHNPHVRTGDELSFGERAADRMKAVFATWTALGAILGAMAVWMLTAGFGVDPMPFILLNLCLSCLAALQCFVLLIAAKRSDQKAAEVALGDYKTDQATLDEVRALRLELAEVVLVAAQQQADAQAALRDARQAASEDLQTLRAKLDPSR